MRLEPRESALVQRDKPCDLIMKGGITSGIVYPSAVLALRGKGYRFSSIGGTSAGAIAAVATAAAQYGEMAGASAPPDVRESQGFAALNALQHELATPGLMKQLFRPTKKARPVFELLLKLQETKGRFRKLAVGVIALLRRLWLQTLAWVLGALVALAFMISRFGGGDERTAGAWVVLGLILFLVGVLTLGASAAFRAWRLFAVHLPTNYYGICNGMPSAKGEPLALTQWLYERIQACAGLPIEEPLTFEHLEDKDVHLSMMTTDLTYAVPRRFPLKTEASPRDSYLFAVEEFRVLFPEKVVDKMIEVSERVETQHIGLELRSLPMATLPVIVASRMSLSFPILLSAVPLWTRMGNTPVRHWMSDGGITSNFPIHFFDAWLPSKPTFGLNLIPARRASDPGTQQAAARFQEDPYVHVPPRRRAEIGSTIGFLSQILDTMQNWRDLLQSELPGFRDRIQSIELEPNEGGLNLTMSPEVIEALISKGTAAGLNLAETFNWDLHRVERYRTLMYLLDREINVGEGSNPGMKLTYEKHVRELLIPSERTEPGTPTDEWGPGANERTASFLASTAPWGKYFVPLKLPDPDPQLRVTSR